MIDPWCIPDSTAYRRAAGAGKFGHRSRRSTGSVAAVIVPCRGGRRVAGRGRIPLSASRARWADADAILVGNIDGNLALTLKHDGASSARALTFSPMEALTLRSYDLFASPTLHAGQSVLADVKADQHNPAPLIATMFLRTYGEDDAVTEVPGPRVELGPGTSRSVEWTVLDVGGAPICAVGFTIQGSSDSTLLVDRMDWTGAPTVTLGRPGFANKMWRLAWVNGVDQWEARWADDYRIVQNRGTGLISQGNEGWEDYSAAATVTVPLAASAGLAVRVGGLRRYYALTIERDGFARIIRMDTTRTVLAEVPLEWDPDRSYRLESTARGEELKGTVDGTHRLTATDGDTPLRGGGVGLVVTEGSLASGPVAISPA